jgi:hypothetical protein
MNSRFLALIVVLVSAHQAPRSGSTTRRRRCPRTPDGKPNLAAPPPRTADGRPDLSGIWQLEPRPCGPEGCGDYAAAAEFVKHGAKLRAACRISRGPPRS